MKIHLSISLWRCNVRSKKFWKILLFSVIVIIDAYLLYGTIGYLILGIQTPKIVGVENTTFMGMYMMSITYFCIFAVVTAIAIVLGIKFFRKKSKKLKSI